MFVGFLRLKLSQRLNVMPCYIYIARIRMYGARSPSQVMGSSRCEAPLLRPPRLTPSAARLPINKVSSCTRELFSYVPRETENYTSFNVIIRTTQVDLTKTDHIFAVAKHNEFQFKTKKKHFASIISRKSLSDQASLVMSGTDDQHMQEMPLKI